MRKTRGFHVMASVAATLLAGVVSAQNIYSTSFETSEGYTVNTSLNGQQGWSVDGTANVVNTSAAADGTNFVAQQAGSQISRAISSSATKVIVTGHYRGAGVDTLQTPDNSTPMSVVIGFEAVDAGTFTVRAWDGNAEAYVGNQLALDNDEWHKIVIVIDFSAHTYSVAADNQAVAANVPFHSNTVSSISEFIAAAQTTANVDALSFLASDGDSDDDGISDEDEILGGSDPTDDDSDDDQFTDLAEVQIGSDPNDPAVTPITRVRDHILGKVTLTEEQLPFANLDASNELLDAADIVKQQIED